MPKDPNFVNPMLAVLNTDGTTIKSVVANPTTHGLKVLDGASGSDNGPINALKNPNMVSTLLATSSADGVSLVPLYTDSSGFLLIKTT